MIRPRPEIAATPRTAHGGPVGTADADLPPVRIDFSVSLNAWGPAEAVLNAVDHVPLGQYPDPDALAPRHAAAERWDRPVEEIGFGAGAAEWIHAVCFAYLRPGDTVLIPGPTFGEYARAAALCGGRLLQGMALPPRYALAPDVIAEAVLEHRPRLAFLCAPNNPTGQSFTRDNIREVADACARVGSLLVLDQSYDAFLAEPLGTPALPGHPAVLALRSITKDHALAGARAGFAVGPAAVLTALERARVPWAASTVAQAAAVAALSDAGEAHVAATIPRLRSERERLEDELERLSLSMVPTATHFLLAEVGFAAPVAERLRADYGIRVRDCASFGLPGWIRIAARTPWENNELVRALAVVC